VSASVVLSVLFSAALSIDSGPGEASCSSFELEHIASVVAKNLPASAPKIDLQLRVECSATHRRIQFSAGNDSIEQDVDLTTVDSTLRARVAALAAAEIAGAFLQGLDVPAPTSSKNTQTLSETIEAKPEPSPRVVANQALPDDSQTQQSPQTQTEQTPDNGEADSGASSSQSLLPKSQDPKPPWRLQIGPLVQLHASALNTFFGATVGAGWRRVGGLDWSANFSSTWVREDATRGTATGTTQQLELLFGKHALLGAETEVFVSAGIALARTAVDGLVENPEQHQVNPFSGIYAILRARAQLEYNVSSLWALWAALDASYAVNGVRAREDNAIRIDTSGASAGLSAGVLRRM